MADFNFCCDALRSASEYGTDAEGYAGLIEIDCNTQTWDFANSVLLAPYFCPWCGAANVNRNELNVDTLNATR